MSNEAASNKFTKEELEAAMKVLKAILSDEKITVKMNCETKQKEISNKEDYTVKAKPRPYYRDVKNYNKALCYCTVGVTPTTYDKVIEEAIKRKTSRTAIMREALDEYFDNHVA